ncbi:hypothetical protein AB0902_36555 [Streptomyces syringium]
MLVIDDSGDRTDGRATAQVGKQCLGSVGKIAPGIVTVTTCLGRRACLLPLARRALHPRPPLPRRETSTWYLAPQARITAPGAQPAPGRRSHRSGTDLRAAALGRTLLKAGHELGWADFQVRSDTAIRRHQTLVTCAFSFCWDTWFTPPPPDTYEEEPARGRTERPILWSGHPDTGS